MQLVNENHSTIADERGPWSQMTKRIIRNRLKVSRKILHHRPWDIVVLEPKDTDCLSTEHIDLVLAMHLNVTRKHLETTGVHGTYIQIQQLFSNI